MTFWKGCRIEPVHAHLFPDITGAAMSGLSLSFAPLLGWHILGMLAAAGLVLLALGLAAKRASALLRALALALLLLALANPSLVKENRTKLKDVVAVVVDHSGSQTIGERPAQTKAALAGVRRELDALGQIDTRVINLPKSDSFTHGTRLFRALSQGLSDVPPGRLGGVIMITDGEVHDIPPSLRAWGVNAPLHVLVTGHKGERDRRIKLTEAPKYGIVGKDLIIGATVLDSGADPLPVVVDITHDGKPAGKIRAAVGAPLKIPVKIDHGGPNIIELSVEPVPGELTTLNNQAVLSVDGVRDKLKVLLVSGEPHQGERMWRNILKSDPNVDLVHFTILRPPDKNDGTPVNQLSLIAFPVADLFGNKIKDFDLIIFDRYANLNILPEVYLDNIVAYVRHGGALLIAAGPEFAKSDSLFYSPLGDIAPASPNGKIATGAFNVTLSKLGRRHPVTRDLPGWKDGKPDWSPWYRRIGAKMIRGDDILTGDGKPLLVLAHEKKGRIAMLLSDQMWLWARDHDGGGPYLELLRRLAHWMMKEPDLEEEALRARASGQDIRITRQTLKSVVPEVTLTAPSGLTSLVKLRKVKPGLWRAGVKATEPGLYHLDDGILTALVNAGADNPLEFQDVISSTRKLAPLAEASGGSVRRIAEGTSGAISLPRIVAMRDAPSYAGADFIGIHRTGASRLISIGISPLAIGVLAMLALLASMLVAWLVEGRRVGEV